MRSDHFLNAPNSLIDLTANLTEKREASVVSSEKQKEFELFYHLAKKSIDKAMEINFKKLEFQDV